MKEYAHTYMHYTEPIYNNFADRVKVIRRLYALSFLFLKEQGRKVVLMTDDIGREIFRDVPYDSMMVCLNNVSPRVKHAFWAVAKLEAMKYRDAVYIDGDVFIKSKAAIDIIERDAEITVQMPERDVIMDGYQWALQRLKDVGTLKPYIDAHNGEAFNTGVFYLSPDHRKRYLKAVWDSMHAILKNADLFNDPKRGEYMTVVEQIVASGYAKMNGLTVNHILQPEKIYRYDSNVNMNIQAEADAIGYVHLWCGSKFTTKTTERVLQLLREIDTTLYNKLL
jgi:hypothetical protein